MKIDRKEVYNKFNGHCAYCGKELKDESGKYMQVDHIEPQCNIRYRNVSYATIYSDENRFPSCKRCNHYKRGSNLEMFRYTMKTLHQRIAANYINKVAIDYGIIELKPFDGVFYFEKYQQSQQIPPEGNLRLYNDKQ